MAARNISVDYGANRLTSAREKARRYPLHVDLIRKFLQTFEKRVGEPDAKFGFLKYKMLLRAAANRHIDTLFIELDDLAEFCTRELREPDEQLSAALAMPKLQMQEAVEQLTVDLEENTSRYRQFFYEACLKELPERDEGFNVARKEVAKDATAAWRKKNFERMQAEGVKPQFPFKLEFPCDIRFKPRSEMEAMSLRAITADKVGSLVQLECLVVRANSVKPCMEVATYHCDVCEAEVFQTVEGDRYTPLQECPSQRCQDNKQRGKMTINLRTCVFSRNQEIRVQELARHVPPGGVPRSTNVVLSGDLCRTVLPGDVITLTGVFTPYQLPWFQAKQAGLAQEMYIDCHNMWKHKHGYDEGPTDDQIALQLDEAAAQGSLYEKASKSIAPEIFGHHDVKKALLMVLLGAPTKTMKDGMKMRGDIHTLMMGDPGVAKSQLMKQVCNIAPRSVYTTGKGSSGVGLTASVVRDRKTGEVTLEGGALVLADNGICCIDEFDKMDESDRTAIHEVMEQQSVSIAKAGITTTLNTRTTILAAANPLDGRYNPHKSPVDNIDLPAALLSRFDLLFLFIDTIDPHHDKKLALHVCKVHSNYSGGSDQKGGDDPPDGDVLGLGFQPYSAAFMRQYIRKAKTFEPMIDNAIQQDMVDAYVSMRDDEKNSRLDSRKSYTTPRTLLAILRISQAHARARFSNLVEREDFEEALRLMKASKESVENSLPTERTNVLDVIYDIVTDLTTREADGDGWVDMGMVISMASHKAVSEDTVMEAVENWESLSVFQRSENKTKVRFVTGSA